MILGINPSPILIHPVVFILGEMPDVNKKVDTPGVISTPRQFLQNGWIQGSRSWITAVDDVISLHIQVIGWCESMTGHCAERKPSSYQPDEISEGQQTVCTFYDGRCMGPKTSWGSRGIANYIYTHNMVYLVFLLGGGVRTPGLH